MQTSGIIIQPATVSNKMHNFYKIIQKQILQCSLYSPTIQQFSKLPLAALPIVLHHAGAITVEGS
jgi:hypothetical protein